MSLSNTARALPALLRAGVLEAVAYRAELLVWMLSTTLPLIMLALFSTVAREAPLGRMGARDITTYFVATFVVRQMTGSWAAWQINEDIRQGTLSTRLLKPVHPVASYAADNVAAMPIRALAVLPVGAVGLWWVGASALPATLGGWAMFAASVAGGWLLTFLLNVMIGSVGFFAESSLKVMDLYILLFITVSGYTVPIELFPPALRGLINYLPFRYQIGLPVEMLTSAHGQSEALRLLGAQWLHVAALGALTALLWARGIKRFEAYGG